MPDNPSQHPVTSSTPSSPPPTQPLNGIVVGRRTFLAWVASFLAVLALAAAEGIELVRQRGLGIVQPPSTWPGPSTSSGPVASGPAPSASEEPIQSAPPPGPDRTGRENLRQGSTAWLLPLAGRGSAEGYASDVSTAEGEPISFHLSSAQPDVTVTLYRLGWYGGLGARPVMRWRNVDVAAQPAAVTDPRTGMVRAAWAPAVTATTSGGWVSGLFVAVLAPTGGQPQYVPLIVRETSPSAPILFVSSASTHQAYNTWGGKSLYPDESTGAPTITGQANAVIATWDRPVADYRGGSLMLRWEYPFVRWMESRGYDVGYCADFDLERHPELLTGRRLLVFVGHPEYWSVGMRRSLEAAIAAGTNVAFFSADEVYWRVRYDRVGDSAFRAVTCYRNAEIDPLAKIDPTVATTKWRDPPSKDPESRVIGQMYGHVVSVPANFVCSAPDHWLYEGTGMVAGDGIVNLVGQEYDRFWTGAGLSPDGTQILATSPVVPNLQHETSIYGSPSADEPVHPVHNATIYTAASGATVFSAGTMQWSWALDDWGSPSYAGVRTPLDWRVGRMTSNVLDRLGV
jgi:hypothetical protein